MYIDTRKVMSSYNETIQKLGIKTSADGRTFCTNVIDTLNECRIGNVIKLEFILS